MERHSKCKKFCVVPGCNNNTDNSPYKVYFHVPLNPTLRRNWLNAMNKTSLSSKSAVFCCEDHFTIETEMENYMQYKIMGNVKRAVLKPGVIPHIFHCQEGTSGNKRFRMAEDCVEEVKENLDPNHHNIAVQVTPSTSEKGNQTKNLYHVRSKTTNTDKIEQKTVALSPIKETKMINKSTSPIWKHLGETSEPTSSEYDLESVEEERSDHFEYKMRELTILAMKKESKLYMGISSKSYILIEELTKFFPELDVLLVFRKIKLNESFAILGINFELNKSSVSRIFSKRLPFITDKMRELIYWPEQRNIQKHLPMGFKARYGNIVSIIDCLEIEIEKPSNPVMQSLTWSQYKGCNTLKYLISCTPDGLVNFISCGYGGRASDVAIVEASGYLDKLMANTAVMADRGFKGLAEKLNEKNCVLVRPPSVLDKRKSTRSEVMASKTIAALRIHVERVIGRLREFQLLAPHACVDNQLIKVIDDVVTVACGIINMQDHIIKTQI